MNVRTLVLSATLILVASALSSCSASPTFAASDLPATVRVVDQGPWITLEPTGKAKTFGLMFYPGGLVKPEAYELALAGIASAGYPVVIPKMPFDLAFFDAEKGLTAKAAVPGVQKWAIAGHSLGGVAAAIAVTKHPDAFAGVVFWASYTTKDASLAALTLPVLSISASNDGLSTPTKIADAVQFLPAGAERVEIQGGIHAQFATYGDQKGDGQATISREEQQALVTAATLAFLGKF